MPADRDQIRSERSGGKRHLQEPLHRIAVRERRRILLLGGTEYTLHVKACAGLVVDHHQADQCSRNLQRGKGGVGIQHPAGGTDAHHLKALVLQPAHNVFHGRMLAVGRDNPPPSQMLAGKQGAEQGCVARFGAAGRKNQFSRHRAADTQRVCNTRPRAGKQAGRLLSCAMQGGRISEDLHRLQHGGFSLLTQRRGRTVVQIMPCLHRLTPS